MSFVLFFVGLPDWSTVEEGYFSVGVKIGVKADWR